MEPEVDETTIFEFEFNVGRGNLRQKISHALHSQALCGSIFFGVGFSGFEGTPKGKLPIGVAGAPILSKTIARMRERPQMLSAACNRLVHKSMAKMKMRDNPPNS